MTEIYFRDQVVIEQPVNKSILEDAHQLLENNENGTITLLAQIDATHSGLLTSMRVYPGVHVRKSYKSYFSIENGGTADYDKPVLRHHEHDEDAIGRITGGQFIKFKQGDAFKKDFLNPDTKDTGGKGSGVVRLSTEITEADSISKIIDGRLLSVSSGHSSESMTCSLCSKPVLSLFERLFGEGDEDACDHIPGKTYNTDEHKGLCFGITGPLTYHEVSFVNIPAQPAARLTKGDWKEVKMADSVDGRILAPISVSQGKKSCISSMILRDSGWEFDLLAANQKRTGNKVCVSMAVADKVISSVLGEESSEDDTDPNNVEQGQVEPPEDTGRNASSRTGKASDASNKELGSTSGDADSHRKSTPHARGSGDNSSNKLDDDSYGEDMANKPDTKLSVDALQASIESLTQDNETFKTSVKQKDVEIESLKSQIETKDSEISRLTDDMSVAQGNLAKDYATIVAQYRVLLSKPGTEGLDDKESKSTYVEDLAKRSVESLRDSIGDLSEEYKKFLDDAAETAKKPKSKTGIDLSDERLTSPTLSADRDADADSKQSVTSDKHALADKALGLN